MRRLWNLAEHHQLFPLDTIHFDVKIRKIYESIRSLTFNLWCLDNSTMKKPNHSEHGASCLGVLMFFGSLLTIVFCVINYFYNRVQANTHPWITLFSGGSNLSKYGYNFLPPWTGFEVTVLVIGAIGFIVAVVSD